MSELQKLQNGSDIRGIALSGVAGEDVNLTPATANIVAQAFAHWLADKLQKKPDMLRIGIGRDSRISGPDLLAAAADGLSSCGVTVYDCGIASTPAMFMSTVLPGFGYDGSIMITASHLPFNRNGLKFFTRAGGLEKGDISALLAKAEPLEPCAGNPQKISIANLMDAYAENLQMIIRTGISDGSTPLAGFKVAVDAGNGAGGFFATKVLVPLGADISASQFLDPDGSFPNHIPNPEDGEAMEAILRAVKTYGCDFGIIFDTDVDRAGAVGADGQEINRNRLIALISAIVLEENPGATIVTDSVTSAELTSFIEEELGGKHHRFKRGYKNVINEAVRLEDMGISAPLAIETSGHGALKENYYLDDGAYLIAKILIKLARLRKEGKTLGHLLAALGEPAESKELRFKIDGDNFKEYAASVLADLEDYAKGQAGWQIAPNNYEGIRIFFDADHGNGWLLLRMSLHDPLMPLNIESSVADGVKIITNELYPFIRQYPRLNISPLTDFLKI